MSKYEIKKATVLSTEIIDDDETRRQMQYFVSTLELYTDTGIIQKKIKTAQPLTEGSYVDVKYNDKKRTFSLVKKTKDSDWGMVFLIFFIVASFIAFTAISYNLLEIEGDIKEVAIRAYIDCVVLISIIWAILVAVLIVRRGKILKHCMVVNGKLVGFIKQGYEPTNESNPRLRHAPIYEYPYGSLMHRYKSSRMRTDADKSIQIAVNNITGEVFGVEDRKNHERMKILLMFFSYFCFAFLVFIVFLMARNG